MRASCVFYCRLQIFFLSPKKCDSPPPSLEVNEWFFIKQVVHSPVPGAPGYAGCGRHVTCPQEACNQVNLARKISHKHIHEGLTTIQVFRKREDLHWAWGLACSEGTETGGVRHPRQGKKSKSSEESWRAVEVEQRSVWVSGGRKGRPERIWNAQAFWQCCLI